MAGQVDKPDISWEKLRELVEASYKAGFMASHQRWNAEAPFHNRDPGNSIKWQNEAKANLNRVINEVLK